MINTLQEIQDRFEKIKDHKPKASKKLNELGDILASAYKISSELADEMWQYIVDLNVDDDVANAKFYVAQVFNKVSDRLSPEEATRLISMNPDRVRLMVLYGYDGFKLWDCLDTLVRGYIQISAADEAIVCVEYFYEKFDGINSDRTEVYRVARKAALICVEYIQNGDFSEEAERLLDLLCASEKADFIAKLQIALKEANETGYWLELLFKTNYISEEEYKSLDSACTSIRVMLISSISTAKENAK